MTPIAFAKLFDTPHGQVLVTRDFDSDNDDELVVVRAASAPGYKAETEYRYDRAIDAHLAFVAFGQDDANRIAFGLGKILSELTA